MYTGTYKIYARITNPKNRVTGFLISQIFHHKSGEMLSSRQVSEFLSKQTALNLTLETKKERMNHFHEESLTLSALHFLLSECQWQ